MRKGTRSILFGVHQFIWHPITVYIAWIYLYHKLPSLKETICIIIHDWGYWGKNNMDDEEGETHPELGAKIAGKILGDDYYWMCLLHSRHYAKTLGKEPSPLCWADKLSIIMEPYWLYLPRAYASGELFEYRKIASEFISLTSTHREWYKWVRERLIKLGQERRGDAVPYMSRNNIY